MVEITGSAVTVYVSPEDDEAVQIQLEDGSSYFIDTTELEFLCRAANKHEGEYDTGAFIRGVQLQGKDPVDENKTYRHANGARAEEVE